MLPETDFELSFYVWFSVEYGNQLQAFIDETIDSYTGDYLPPVVEFRYSLRGYDLEGLRNDYRKKTRMF